jgi:glycosyltransferase involved in cell wall biosynthesis
MDARMVHYRPTGGIGQYTVTLLRALARAPEVGPDARFYVLQMREGRVPLVRDRRFRRVPMWTPPHNRFEQLALGLEMLKLRPQPDLIHSPDFIPPRYRLFRAVANIQDLAFLKFPDLTLLTDDSKRYYDQVYRAAHDADALIALSESAREDTISLLRADPAKVTVIPPGVDYQFKPPGDLQKAARQASNQFNLPRPEEGGYILFVGTIEPRKNLPVLLEAFRMLLDSKRVQPPPALAIAGREGWLFEKVHARIDELKLRDRVRLLGAVSEPALVALYQGARVFALPSLYEGFGLPALEALACGVPTITSNAGSLPEVVGEAGILLDPHDVLEWADALERVLLDEQEAERLRLAGLRQAASFSWEQAAAQTWALYQRVARQT